MIRKVYRKYFKDNDKSFDKIGDFYRVNCKEFDTLQDLEKGEAASIVYHDNVWKVATAYRDFDGQLYLDNKKVDKIELTNIYKVIVCTSKRNLFEAAKQKALAIFSLLKGFIGQNGNEMDIHTPFGVKPLLGSFNKLSINNSNVNFMFSNARNKIEINGHIEREKTTNKIICASNITVIADKDNIIKVTANKCSNISLIAHNNNYIELDDNAADLPLVFKENNLVIYPDFSYDLDDVYLTEQRPLLAIKKRITAQSNAGDNYIEVDDTQYVLKNHKILYMTKEKGFVIKKVVGVDGNKIFITPVIKEGEEPVVDGFVVSEVPRKIKEVTTQSARKVLPFGRRIYLKDDISSASQTLFQDEVIIKEIDDDGSDWSQTQTVINYYDENSRLLIVADTLKNQKPVNVEVRVLPFDFGEMEFVIGKDNPNLYIGQKVVVDDKTYTVVGFGEDVNSIKFKELDDISSLNGKTAKALADDNLTGNIQYFHKLKVIEFKKYNNYLLVEKDNNLNIGDKIICGAKVFEVENIETYDNQVVKVFIDTSLISLTFSDKIIYKGMIIDRNISIEDIKGLYEKIKELKE